MQIPIQPCQGCWRLCCCFTLSESHCGQHSLTLIDSFWNLHLRCLNNCRYHLLRSCRHQLMSVWQNLEGLLQDCGLHSPSSPTSWYYSTLFKAAELHNNWFCVLSHGWAQLHCPGSPQCKYQLLCLGSLLRSGYSQTIPLLTALFAMTCHSWPLRRSSPQSHMWDLQMPIFLAPNPLKTIRDQGKHWDAPSLHSDSVYTTVAPAERPQGSLTTPAAKKGVCGRKSEQEKNPSYFVGIPPNLSCWYIEASPLPAPMETTMVC